MISVPSDATGSISPQEGSTSLTLVVQFNRASVPRVDVSLAMIRPAATVVNNFELDPMAKSVYA